MVISDLIGSYCADRELCEASRRRFRYDLATWSRHDGPLLTGNISAETVAEWRHNAKAHGLSVRTIESVISGVVSLLKHGGIELSAGRKLRFVPSPPDVPTLEEFDRLIVAAGVWHRRWLAFAYATGLRLGDIEQQSPDRPSEIDVRATKTRKRHVIPIPEPVRRLLDGASLNRPRRRLRKELYSLCDRANVRHIGPQQIRALSATEWERSRPGAGAVILGHSLPGWSAATHYYLDPSQQLRLALPAFRLPPSLLTDDERAAAAQREQEVVSIYRHLPEQQQETAVSVLRAMSR
jgi:integrase